MIRRSIIGLVLLGTVSCARGQAPGATTDAGPKTYTVPAGTKILLSLKNEISTRVAAPGDSVYLISDFPVVAGGVVVLPAGMYVKGFIDSVQRPGKVKGRAQLRMHFASMIFPNGVEVAIPGTVDKAPGSGEAKVKDAEGTIEQAGSKGKDAQRVTSRTIEGAGVGSLVGYGTGNVGMGAGIGAGAGAAVGILSTLFTRGNDLVFQQGTTMEMVISRPIVLQQSQLVGMPASTGMMLAAPAGTQPAALPKPNH